MKKGNAWFVPVPDEKVYTAMGLTKEKYDEMVATMNKILMVGLSKGATISGMLAEASKYATNPTELCLCCFLLGLGAGDQKATHDILHLASLN